MYATTDDRVGILLASRYLGKSVAVANVIGKLYYLKSLVVMYQDHQFFAKPTAGRANPFTQIVGGRLTIFFGKRKKHG